MKDKIKQKLDAGYCLTPWGIKTPKLYLNYSWTSILARLVISTMVALSVMYGMRYILTTTGETQMIMSGFSVKQYGIILLCFSLLMECLVVVDSLFEKVFPVPFMFRTRLIIQFGVALVLIICFAKIANVVVARDELIPDIAFYLGMSMGLVFVTVLSHGLMIIRLSDKWIKSQKVIDQMKQEKLEMSYNSLQEQVNPHFLFNNLSVLKSLIIYDKDGAIKFTENFTDVYRYVLESKDETTVTLSHELVFIESYLNLHEERLGDGLNVKFSIAKTTLQKQVAPLTLQLLVENVLKHNIVSVDEPLTLEIRAENDQLVVINNINPKEVSNSTKTGLTNLQGRYKLLSETAIEVLETSTSFSVTVPLDIKVTPQEYLQS